LVLLAMGLVCGCQTGRDVQELDSECYWGKKSRLAVQTAASELCAQGSDPAASREARCLAVARLFATYVKPGFTSQEMHAALVDLHWLDACELLQRTGSGGQSAVVASGAQSLFMLVLCPDDTGSSGWVIYFVLPDDPWHGARTVEEGRAFLAGDHPNKRLKLVEFAIVYPLCEDTSKAGGVRIVERFVKRGVGLQLRRP